MPSKGTYFVYILSSRSRNLYTGVTNHLERRLAQHKKGIFPGFSKHYRIERLVYYEIFGDIRAAIAREKMVKHWKRERRIALIESQNPAWADLSDSIH